MTDPTTLRAGDSATWSCDLPDYSADDGWAAHYRLIWPSAEIAPRDISTTAAGTLHTVQLDPTDTRAYASGPATLVKWVTHTDGRRVTLGSSAITILPDLTSLTRHDPRSANEIALADARAALAAYVASGRLHVAEYTINGRAMKFRGTEEISKLISHYERQVAADNALAAALSGVASGRICTRM